MTKKLWGGRFTKPTDPLFEDFSRSLRYDYRLGRYDLIGSLVHVSILRESGFLSVKESNKLTSALRKLYRNFDGAAVAAFPDEDIHTYIQNELLRKVGPVALKLHTARSRNDQVAFATKLFCKIATKRIAKLIEQLLGAIRTADRKWGNFYFPGFTHLQHAQPVLFRDFLGAYRKMFQRDLSRARFIAENVLLTLGAGAVAGTPIPASYYKKRISDFVRGLPGEEVFSGITILPTDNAIDSVSDRDFIIDTLALCASIGMHISRISEELILWTTQEFDFIDLDERFCTGSSLMPQKKNPDAAELLRGYTGRFYGNLISVLVMLKGLPFAYNRDMQLDKEPFFDSCMLIDEELRILTGIFHGFHLKKENLQAVLQDESFYATDLAYYLVRKGVAFTEAHTIVGKLVHYSLQHALPIAQMTSEQLRKFSAHLYPGIVKKLLNPRYSVQSKRSITR